jgi:hypothetical protein
VMTPFGGWVERVRGLITEMRLRSQTALSLQDAGHLASNGVGFSMATGKKQPIRRSPDSKKVVVRPPKGLLEALRRRRVRVGGMYVESVEGVPAPYPDASSEKALKESMKMADEIKELVASN